MLIAAREPCAGAREGGGGGASYHEASLWIGQWLSRVQFKWRAGRTSKSYLPVRSTPSSTSTNVPLPPVGPAMQPE